METVPREALEALDAAAGTVERLAAEGVELHFRVRRFGRRRNVRVLVSDEHGRTLRELGLLEAVALLSASA